MIRNFIKYTCKICGEPFEAYSKTRKYCSRKCMGIATQGAKSPNWKGGWLHADGYWVFLVDGRKTLAHRHIMEQHLGRSLRKEEILHHINGDRLDNRIENLLITTLEDHICDHHATFRSDTHKQCTICREVKPRSEFCSGSKIARDPHDCRCKKCKAEQWTRREK